MTTLVGEVMGDPYEIDILGFPVNIAPLEIDSIKLVGVNGLPSVMSTYLSNPDSVFMGNDIACVTLFGTPGNNELGTHDISLIIDGWINVSVIGTVSLYDQLGDYETIDGYRLVVQSEMVSIDENNNLPFSVSQNSPNPFSKASLYLSSTLNTSATVPSTFEKTLGFSILLLSPSVGYVMGK